MMKYLKVIIEPLLGFGLFNNASLFFPRIIEKGINKVVIN